MSTAYQKIPEHVRDCVKKYLESGAQDKYQFRDLRHGIICELKRLECSIDVVKNIMVEWNSRNYVKLSYKKFSQQIVSYIGWVFKTKNVKVGCNYFKDRGYCDSVCQFMTRTRTKANADLSQEVIYAEDEIIKFLTEYDKCKYPRECAIIYKIIDKKRITLGITRLDGIVFMALREMQKKYWEQGYTRSKITDISRLIYRLEESGLLEIVKKGKSNSFGGLANGYRLRIPEDVYNDDLFNYDDTRKTDPETQAHP